MSREIVTTEARNIKPGDYYRGRKVFSVARNERSLTLKIVVVCPKHLPLVGQIETFRGKRYQSGKFTFRDEQIITFARDEGNPCDVIRDLLD